MVAGGDLEQQEVAHEGEQLGVELRPALGGRSHGGLHHLGVGGGRGLAGADVGAVDGEAGQHLPQHLVHLAAGVVAMTTALLAGGHQQVHDPVDVGAQHLPQDQVLALLHGVVPAGRLPRASAGHLPVELGEGLLAGGVDEEPGDDVQEVVAGGAAHRPRPGEGLSHLEDLLHDDVGAARLLVQPAEVAGRIAQTVDVVDPEALHPAAPHQPEHGLVGGGEDPAGLDAQADQGGDVEEPAVVELLAGRPPEGQSVVLALEQGVEGVGIRVGGGHRPVDGPGQVEVLVQQAGQVALDDTALVGGRGRRQPSERHRQAGQLV